MRFVGAYSQLPFVYYLPVECLKLPARFNHNRGHVGCGITFTATFGKGKTKQVVTQAFTLTVTT